MNKQPNLFYFYFIFYIGCLLTVFSVYVLHNNRGIPPHVRCRRYILHMSYNSLLPNPYLFIVQQINNEPKSAMFELLRRCCSISLSSGGLHGVHFGKQFPTFRRIMIPLFWGLCNWRSCETVLFCFVLGCGALQPARNVSKLLAWYFIGRGAPCW